MLEVFGCDPPIGSILRDQIKPVKNVVLGQLQHPYVSIYKPAKFRFDFYNVNLDQKNFYQKNKNVITPD